MVSCDICGKDAITTAKVEGAVLNVCRACSRFGLEMKPQKSVVLKVEGNFKPKEFEVIAGFGKRIRGAREALKLAVEDLGKKLSISPSLISDWESEKFKPSVENARKLESFLKILLLQEVSGQKEHALKPQNKPNEFTLADLVEIKRK